MKFFCKYSYDYYFPHTSYYYFPHTIKEVFKEVFKEYTTRARDLLFILEEIKKEVFFTYILLFCDPFQIFLLLKFHHGYLRIIYNHQHDISIYLLISLLTVFHGFLDHHNQLNFFITQFFMILDVCLSSFFNCFIADSENSTLYISDT